MRLLHLEDNDCDAELFENILLREWPDSHITRVSTRREYEMAVRLENFVVILSDHSMVGFDGLIALDLARACCPETPFVFLSGTIGEERAIEALKRGAADYVLKDSPARLLPAVRSALLQGQLEVAKRHASKHDGDENSARTMAAKHRRKANVLRAPLLAIRARGQTHVRYGYRPVEIEA